MRALLVFVVLVGCGVDPRRGESRDTGAATDSAPVDSVVVDNGAVRMWCRGQDTDGDGVCDAEELRIGTDPARVDTDDDGISDFDELNLGTDPLRADTDGDGMSDGEERELGTNPVVPDQACAMHEARAVPRARPIDVIFVIDNSASMEEEIRAVQNNISRNFADIIGASNIDYRLIIISAHGEASRWKVCISTPLSGHSCTPVPDRPIFTQRFYQYNIDVINVALYAALLTYNTRDFWEMAPTGWQAWLRPEAFKEFVFFTDDDDTLRTAAQFDDELLQHPEQFGTRARRNYLVHSIVGLAPKADPGAAYEPTEPIQTSMCPGERLVVNEGRQYQELSVLTGGLRFPLCQYGRYDVIFRRIAEGVVGHATLPCTYAVPTSQGNSVDPQRLVLQYTPHTGSAERWSRVQPDQCRPGAWYVQNNSIELCPDACTHVTERAGEIRVLAGCGIVLD